MHVLDLKRHGQGNRGVALLVAAVLVCAGFPLAPAQANAFERIVEGHVSESHTGMALSGARLHLSYYDSVQELDLFSGEVLTAPDGSYELLDEYGHGSGPYTVSAVATGYVTESREFTWDGVEAVSIDLALKDAELIATGAVKDSQTGDPIDGAQLIVERYDMGSFRWRTIGIAYSDSSGSFEVWDSQEHGSGTYRFGVGAPAYTYAVSDPYAWDGINTVVLELPLEPAPVIVEGAVTDAIGGAPVAGARVDAARWDAGSGQWTSVDQQYSASDGGYSVRDLYGRGAGTYRLTVGSPEHLPESWQGEWDGESAQAVDFVLEPWPSLAVGSVCSSSTGAPIEAASVRAEFFSAVSEGWVDAGETTTTPDGAYALGDANRHGAGEYRFFASATGHREVGPIMRVRLDSTQTVTVDFELEDAGSPPVAGDDSYVVRQDDTLRIDAPGLLTNDEDPDGETLTAVLEHGPAHGSLTLLASGSFEYAPDAGWSGTDSFAYRASDGWNLSEVATVTIVVEPREFSPVSLEGANRYGTAIAASRAAFGDGTVQTVVIATGENFADALGGAALAGAVDGPLLITKPNDLRDDVVAEIGRLGATSAYLLGGTAALSEQVETDLGHLLGEDAVERIAGRTRYATANLIAEEVVEVLGEDFGGAAFVATGEDFPDALGASPVSAAEGMPILLVKQSFGSVPVWLENATILGGEAAVSADVEDALKSALGNENVERLAGSNRYATAGLVAEYGFDVGMRWDGVGVATGEDFPDALAGGPVLGSMDSVMLLTKSTVLSAQTRGALQDHRGGIETVHFLGGTAAVSAGVRSEIRGILE